MTSTEQLWARGLSVADPTPLGWQPIDIVAIFSAGQDWIVTLQPTVATTATIWPVGTTITVNVYAASTNTALPVEQWDLEYSWAADIEANTVYLRGPAGDCDTVENGAIVRVMVTLPDTPNPDNYCWLRGTVQRQD